ncbi:nitroreductase family protein [Bacillus sp. FJAT-50079]|uniref:nitroreductase family protein n=1 Tax=Bacillus sp. FJAT-50079 TaxID=2833577 RepID=UPI001BCA0774|nr:nitroreductase family protein [Bacillus sp. FJAT-50079]MBS4209324.1 nitroreductase family protein [Bacillus sp. FJAT-50079]
MDTVEMRSKPSQDALDMAHLIRERRTIRKFELRPVSNHLVTELLRVSIQSIALDQQYDSYRFLFISSQKAKEKVASAIMKAYLDQRMKWLPNKLNQALVERTARIPAFLIAIQKGMGKAEDRERDYAAICAMLQSFSLLGWQDGLGMVWNTESYIHEKAFSDAIKLQEDERVICIMYIGYFKKIPRAKQRTPAIEKLTLLQE